MGSLGKPPMAHAPLRSGGRRYSITFHASLQRKKFFLAALEARMAESGQRLPLQEARIAQKSLFPKRLGSSYGVDCGCSSRIS